MYIFYEDYVFNMAHIACFNKVEELDILIYFSDNDSQNIRFDSEEERDRMFDFWKQKLSYEFKTITIKQEDAE